MRTDTSIAPFDGLSPQGGRSSQARAGRWLADLEQALIEARPQAGTRHAAASVASALPERIAAHAPGMSPGAVPPVLTAAMRPGTVQAAALASASCTAFASLATTDAPSDAALPQPMTSVACLPATLTAITPRGDTPPMPSATPARIAPQPRRYAPRLMQAAGHEQVQVSVRDAALPATQAHYVACAVFDRLRESGVSVQRIYVNGRVFERAHGDLPAANPPDPLKE